MTGLVTSRRATEFARLVDLAVDRPGTNVACELASDEGIALLVSTAHQLRELRFDADAAPQFRDQLRRRLVAVASVSPPEPVSRPRVPAPRTPMPMTTPGQVATSPAIPPTHRRRHARSPSTSPRLAFLAGALAALVLVSGLTLLVSSRALPGDTLYALKRSSEQIELALVHDPQQRALRQLSFAQTRLTEVTQLAQRDDTGPLGSTQQPGAATGQLTDADGLLLQALGDMDTDTVQAAKQLTSYAVQQLSDSTLSTLAHWAAGQRSTLTTVVSQLPEPAATRVQSSISLLDQIQNRIGLLRRNLSCACIDHTAVDDLGPVPCSPCVPRAGQSLPNGSPASAAPRASSASSAGGSAAHPATPEGRNAPQPGQSGSTTLLPLPILPPLPPSGLGTVLPPLLPPLLPGG